MDKAWAWMKEHPYATAGIIFGVGIVIVLLFFTGKSAPANNNAGAYAAYQQAAASEAASGNQLAAYQAQTQAAANQTGMEVAARANDNSTALAIAQLTAQQAASHDTISADVAKFLATTTMQTTEVASTAAVTINANNNQTSLLANLYDTLVAANKPMTTDDTTVWGPTSTTHTLSYQGSYGQNVSGTIGSTPFNLQIMPGVGGVVSPQMLQANAQIWGSTIPVPTVH